MYIKSDNQPRTLVEVRARQQYQKMMEDWSEVADDFGGSYSPFGDLIEAKQQSDHPSLRDLDTRGRARARQFIYPHRRSNSPPRSKEALFEQSKEYAKGTVVQITPEVVKDVGKALVPYLVKGSKGVMQGLEFVGDHVPGSKIVSQFLKDVGIGGFEVLDKTLDVMPTAMRRTARTLGLPQALAQDIGDATHLLQEVVLIVVPVVKALRVERVATSLARVESESITASLDLATSRPLLTGEGRVGTYGELEKWGKKGDNLTPNHVPQNAYMKQYGIKTDDGIAIMMEEPNPGTGGRHRQTRTYGRRPELSAPPRTELVRDIQDLRQIYQKDGVYTTEIRQSLQEVIQKNKEQFPDLFKKLIGE